jgi:hypothetical protein
VGVKHRQESTATGKPRNRSGKKPLETPFARVPLWLIGRVSGAALQLFAIYDSWSDGDGKVWRSNQEAKAALGWKTTKQVTRMKQQLQDVGAIRVDERPGMRDVIYLQHEPPWTRVTTLGVGTSMSQAHVSTNGYSTTDNGNWNVRTTDSNGDIRITNNSPSAVTKLLDTRSRDTGVPGTRQGSDLAALKQRVAALQG